MIINDVQLGVPMTIFSKTKAQIEAMPGSAGMTAYATDTKQSGYHDGRGWIWYFPAWDDLRVPMTSTKLGGSKDPHFALFLANGGSQGVFAYHFDKASEEELYFSVQLPHGYALHTDIQPHVHWSVITAPAGGTTVRWGLEYTWADINGVYSAPLIIYTTATDPVTRYKHILSSFSDIDGSSIGVVSSMLLCRIFRDVANDNFDEDAALLEIDFHYQSDTIGSRLPSSK
jgi:hypothetical protein